MLIVEQVIFTNYPNINILFIHLISYSCEPPVLQVAFVICEECGDSFPSKMALKRHSKKHEENPDLKFQCEECGKVRNIFKMHWFFIIIYLI